MNIHDRLLKSIEKKYIYIYMYGQGSDTADSHIQAKKETRRKPRFDQQMHRLLSQTMPGGISHPALCDEAFCFEGDVCALEFS